MSRSTERVYRESGEEAYDEAEGGESADSQTDEPTRFDRGHPPRRRSDRPERDQPVG
jgi:hypothetical protein